EGNLLQSNFYGDSITKIDRKGQTQPFVTSGLSGPVGIAIKKETGNVYVANCRGNSIAKIGKDGTVSSFAKSDLFNCPNGISFDRDGNLYAVNFRDNKMCKIDSQGSVALFTTVSAKGLGHLCFNQKDRFYVTASQSHEIYEVMLDGTARRILGNGKRGIVDGADTKARLSFPNGSLVIHGRDGFTSTNLSTRRPLHCRGGRSSAKKFFEENQPEKHTNQRSRGKKTKKQKKT